MKFILTFNKDLSFKIYLFIYLCVPMYVCMHMCSQIPEEGIRFPQAQIIGGYKSLDMKRTKLHFSAKALLTKESLLLSPYFYKAIENELSFLISFLATLLLIYRKATVFFLCCFLSSYARSFLVVSIASLKYQIMPFTDGMI